MSKIIPTWRQRFLASDWLPRLWLLGLPVALTVATIRSIGPWQHALSSVWSAGLVLSAGLLAFLAGYCIAIPSAWLLFSPLLMEQTQRNGGPFQPGDLVQVISGPHRDQIARVYAHGQHETVRVDLGPKAKEQFADLFSGYQLLRVRPTGDNGMDTSQQMP